VRVPPRKIVKNTPPQLYDSPTLQRQELIANRSSSSQN
jgi:hypothetical protein